MRNLLSQSVPIHRPGPDSAETIYCYRAFGLTIHSTIELADLAGGAGMADVVICEADAMPIPPFTLRNGRGVAGTADDLYLHWPAAGTFRIEQGRRITLMRTADADSSSVRICLSGPVLGALLHQRGVLCLHASAVVVGGAAVVLMGESEAGKSTLAAACHQAGQRILADDIVALTSDADGRLLVQPAIPRLKLEPDLADRLQLPAARLSRFHPADRRQQLLTDGFAEQAVALRRMYVLSDGPTLEVTPLSAAEAMLALNAHAYALRILGTLEAAQSIFATTQRLAARVPVLRLSRQRRLEFLADIVRVVQSE